MSALVDAVAGAVVRECHSDKCKKEGCSVSTKGAPKARVIVDLDCRVLRIGRRKRCDYLFVGAEGERAWVAVIELKRGGFKGREVVEQLNGGAAVADRWIPRGRSFDFVPVLAHGKGVSKEEWRRLRGGRVTFRNQTRQVELIRCGQPLADALDRA